MARYVELHGLMLGGCSCCALVFQLNSLGVAFANNALNGDLLFRLSLRRVATVGPLRSFLVSDYMSLIFLRKRFVYRMMLCEKRFKTCRRRRRARFGKGWEIQ